MIMTDSSMDEVDNYDQGDDEMIVMNLAKLLNIIINTKVKNGRPYLRVHRPHLQRSYGTHLCSRSCPGSE